MASRGERIFAWVGVGVAVVSAVALTVAVVLQQVVANQNQSQNAANTNTLNAQSCADNNTETALPAPDVYKPDGTVTALQTTDLVAGTGTAVKSGDCLVVKYYGTLASNGTMFDENFTKPTGFAFTVGQGQVIQGWDQGLIGMRAGGTRRLVIPAALAYGGQSPSSAIPANSDLVFVVKLLRIQ